MLFRRKTQLGARFPCSSHLLKNLTHRRYNPQFVSVLKCCNALKRHAVVFLQSKNIPRQDEYKEYLSASLRSTQQKDVDNETIGSCSVPGCWNFSFQRLDFCCNGSPTLDIKLPNQVHITLCFSSCGELSIRMQPVSTPSLLSETFPSLLTHKYLSVAT